MNRSEHIRETERLNRRYENKYFPKVRDAIKRDISSLIEVIKDHGIDAGIRAISVKIHSGKIPHIVQEMYNEIGLRYARKTWIGLQKQKRAARKSIGIELDTKGFGFVQAWVDFIKKFLYQFLLEKITFSLSETTRDGILTVLYKATEEGWGVYKTVKALEDLPLSATQAARIVRTEIGRAANTGAMAAGSTFEFEQTKEWIAAHDSRTRGNPITGQHDHASHWALDGTTIDYEDVFIDPRNGDRLRYPHDPKASAASTVNCRCNIAIVAKIGENGRLIPKKNKILI